MLVYRARFYYKTNSLILYEFKLKLVGILQVLTPFSSMFIEQNHRGIKARYKPIKGFKDSWCAMIFCHVFEELMQFFRMRNTTPATRRKLFSERFKAFKQTANQAA